MNPLSMQPRATRSGNLNMRTKRGNHRIMDNGITAVLCLCPLLRLYHGWMTTCARVMTRGALSAHAHIQDFPSTTSV